MVYFPYKDGVEDMMAAQHLTRREFEDWRDNMYGFVETTLDKNVRASERRMIAEINRSANEVRAELKAEINRSANEVRAELLAERLKTCEPN